MSDFILCPAAGPAVAIRWALADLSLNDAFSETSIDANYTLFLRGRFEVSSDRRLVIIGEAFDAAGCRLSQESLDRAAHSAVPLETVASRHWGQFVAVAVDAQTVRFYRDPSAGQACYMCRVGRAFFAASSVDLLRLATGQDFEICRDAIIQALAYRDLRHDRTALKTVCELTPGCTASDQNEEVRYAWQPLADLEVGRALAHEEIAGRLERVLRVAVRAQTNGAGRVMLELSGGLDSSLLAMLLADMAIDFTAVTYVGPDARDDESDFARAVCDHLGCQWRGSVLSADHIRLHESAAAHLAWPSARLFTQLFDQAAEKAMDELGCDMIMSGGGGDGTFCYLPSSAPLIDCLGSWKTMLNGRAVVHDLALAHDTTSAEIIWRALRKMSLPHRLSWKRDGSFLSRDARRSLSRRAYHRGIDLGCAPRGKCDHLKQMIGIHNHLDAYGAPRHDALRFPLVSKPVVEAALQIPTWQWFEGGSNRAPVRRLLADRLPPMISGRRSKGGFDAVIRDIFKERSGEMRAHLHDGWLATEKILDVEAVDAEFRRFQESGSGNINRLMLLWDTEMWVRAVRRRKLTPGLFEGAANDGTMRSIAGRSPGDAPAAI